MTDIGVIFDFKGLRGSFAGSTLNLQVAECP